MFLTCFKQFVINRFYDVIDFCHNNSLSAIPTPDDSGLKKESVELQYLIFKKSSKDENEKKS